MSLWTRSTLDRYIGTQFLSTMLFVSLVFITVIGLIQFLTEASSIGGHYKLSHAFFLVISQMLAIFYEMSPVICMLAAILAMGHLASQNELIVMQTSGASILDLIKSLTKTMILFVLFLLLIGEAIVPDMQFRAEKIKAEKLSDGQAVTTQEGTWVHHKNGFVHFAKALSNIEIQDMIYYELNDDLQLQSVRYADHAKYYDHTWHLFDVSTSILTENGVEAHFDSYLPFDIGVSIRAMKLSRLDPEQQNLAQLHKVIRYRRGHDMETQSYELSFWKRIFQPIETLLLAALIIPLLIGPMRDSSMGKRLLTGLSFGLLFFYSGHFLAPVALSLSLPVLLASGLPVLMIGGILYCLVRSNRGFYTC